VNAKFYRADLLKLEPEMFENQFDMAVAINVLHYFDDIDAWKRITDLLRSGITIYSS
jgi:chemotaxis methyl-accepting protein methylase